MAPEFNTPFDVYRANFDIAFGSQPQAPQPVGAAAAGARTRLVRGE
jgi:hypothetical protein